MCDTSEQAVARQRRLGFFFPNVRLGRECGRNAVNGRVLTYPIASVLECFQVASIGVESNLNVASPVWQHTPGEVAKFGSNRIRRLVHESVSRLDFGGFFLTEERRLHRTLDFTFAFGLSQIGESLPVVGFFQFDAYATPFVDHRTVHFTADTHKGSQHDFTWI